LNTTIKALAGRVFGLLATFVAMSTVHAEEWLPVTPEELQLKSEPKAPAAPAIYLYRQVDRDDNAPDEVFYERIKILTDEGRKYGNVEIPYVKDKESVRWIKARTIRPDGSIVEFDGTIYDKQILKARGVKAMAKSFQLPDVAVGSIVEYRYRRALQAGYVFDSRWLLSQELFTRRAKFSLAPSRDFTLRWGWPIGLPDGTEPPKKDHDHVRLETHDVPAFVVEEFMPPEDAMKFRVEFIYDDTASPLEPEKFWKYFGKNKNRDVEKFLDERRALEQAVAQIVQPTDSPDEKLRKLYRYTQGLRNVSFERQRTEEEQKREALKEGGDAGDVLKRGYADGIKLTWLFLGLARAAGFEASPLLVSTRDRYFFDKRLVNPWQLNSNAVAVKVGDQEVFLDPGTPFTPYGMLPWGATGVAALRLDKTGGAFINTPAPPRSSSRIERKAALRLRNTSLEGKVTVTYTGMEAFWRRLAERSEDDTQRRKFLEDEIKGDIPSGIDVKLTNTPDWAGADTPLVAEYELRIPGWAAAAGKRVLMPVGIFSSNEKHAFEHAARVHPLHLEFPFQHADDVTIELPEGWQATSIPKPRSSDLKVAVYNMAAEDGKGTLHLQRDLTLTFIFAKVDFYPTVHNFFQGVRAGDEEQIIVAPADNKVAKQ
jgi:hypothetical protein